MGYKLPCLSEHHTNLYPYIVLFCCCLFGPRHSEGPFYASLAKN